MKIKDKLEALQELVIDAYIEGLETGDINYRDMSPIVALLNQNSIVEEKSRGSIDDEIKKRIKEAEDRRKNV